MKPRISNLLKLFILGLVMNSIVVNACTKGSDAACSVHGSQYCCAKIEYTHADGSFNGHACASRPEIESFYKDLKKGERLTDNFGYSGLWYCDGAVEMKATLIAAVTAIAFTLF